MTENFHSCFWVGFGFACAAPVFIILAQTRGHTGGDFPFVSSDPALITREGRFWRAAAYLAMLGGAVCWAMAFGALPRIEG